MSVAAILSARAPRIITCDQHATVREAVACLAAERIGAMPVLAEGRVAGVFSERDVIYRLHADGPAMLDRPVRDAMTSPAVTVNPQTEALEALSLMTRRRIRHLPVMEGDRLVGFISIGDLVKYRIEKIEAEANAMRDYIQLA